MEFCIMACSLLWQLCYCNGILPMTKQIPNYQLLSLLKFMCYVPYDKHLFYVNDLIWL